jgi:phosphoribosylanthranilate isomerase
MIKPRVKICCISSIEEASLAINYGASALGLVSEMPSGPGVIALEQIAEIAEKVPPPVGTFLLTCKQTVDEIAAQHKICRTNTIQICDSFVDSYDDLRKALPAVKLVQVIHVGGEESLREAVEISAKVDAILLDSGNQKLDIKELGGTGRTHDWTISRRIVESVKAPVFLAGGLKAENVAEAVAKVQPFGLDLCSSVRAGGKLDEEKLRGFFAEIDNFNAGTQSR